MTISRPEKGGRSLACERDFDTLVALALVPDAQDLDTADFGDVRNMGAATGLQVDVRES
jgi:hypothetical protein